MSGIHLHSLAPIHVPGLQGAPGKACSRELCLWALGWWGTTFSSPRVRVPESQAVVGGLGRDHRQQGPEKVLPLPVPNGLGSVPPSSILTPCLVAAGGAGGKGAGLGWLPKGIWWVNLQCKGPGPMPQNYPAPMPIMPTLRTCLEEAQGTHRHMTSRDPLASI